MGPQLPPVWLQSSSNTSQSTKIASNCCWTASKSCAKKNFNTACLLKECHSKRRFAQKCQFDWNRSTTRSQPRLVLPTSHHSWIPICSNKKAFHLIPILKSSRLNFCKKSIRILFFELVCMERLENKMYLHPCHEIVLNIAYPTSSSPKNIWINLEQSELVWIADKTIEEQHKPCFAYVYDCFAYLLCIMTLYCNWIHYYNMYFPTFIILSSLFLSSFVQKQFGWFAFILLMSIKQL